MTDLTDKKLDALERAARRAEGFPPFEPIPEGEGQDVHVSWKQMDLIVEADPATVLALVEEVRRMWSWFEEFREQVMRLKGALRCEPVPEESDDD